VGACTLVVQCHGGGCRGHVRAHVAVSPVSGHVSHLAQAHALLVQAGRRGLRRRCASARHVQGAA
jgi:hypothetical protein